MLSNAYFLAKFRFDTAENEPAKNLLIFPILLTLTFSTTLLLRDLHAPLRGLELGGAGGHGVLVGASLLHEHRLPRLDLRDVLLLDGLDALRNRLDPLPEGFVPMLARILILINTIISITIIARMLDY